MKDVPLTASPSSLPNLAPYQPTGWSDKIVVAKTVGTTIDSSPLAPTDSLYVDWAVVNNGTAPTAARFYTELYVDGGLRQSWYNDPPVNANTYTALLDYPIGSLSVGTHSIKIKTDATGAIAELDEGDNEYTKTITVGGCTVSCSASISEFEIPSANSQPYDIAAGSDGSLWFVEFGANKIGRITTGGIVTEFTIPTSGSGTFSITAGQDGSLWFAEASGNKIGRITTSGVISEFPLPVPNSAPQRITAGRDGNLWFTEIHNIGRITAAGVITESPTPPICPCGAITSGPDGALWFTESGQSKIARMTTAGAFIEFPLPTAISHPSGITAGPDGALWFAESLGNKIGRITTGGVITEFPGVGGPNGITAGPDGNLWFTEIGKIGRITTTGVITEFPVPVANSTPWGITTGADGNIWFTEAFGNKIGRLSLSSCSLTCSATVPPTSQAGVPVAFQATATPTNCTGSPTYDWDFGDGSPHSPQQNPSHAYAAAGTYGWTMTASIPTAAACVRTGVITVTQITSCYPLSVGAYPVGAGTASASTPPNCTGGYRGGTTVSLTATPAAGYAFASWSGSGGSFAAVSSPNTTFTIIGSAFVAANFTRNPRPPTAIFSYTPINPRVGETVTFSDTSVDFPTSWSWDFDGDGLADALTRNPVYVFTAPGPFMVTLRASNSSGSSSVTKEIDVSLASSVLEIVDPNPSLLSSTGALLEDSALLSGPASLVHGAAADGATLVLLRSAVSGPGQVKFSLSSGMVPNDGGLSLVASAAPRSPLSSVTAPVNETPPGSGVFRAFAVYQVPDDFISPGQTGTSDELLQAHRTLAFSAVFTPTSGSPATSPPVTFNLVRPPLVLLHGLWSSAATWTFPLASDYRWPVASIWDYADKSAAGFAANLIVPFQAIQDALANARRPGIAATQADVVAHSMGGILARNWVSSSLYERSDNFGQGDIHKLITLDSPHLGSLLANELIVLRDHSAGLVADLLRSVGKLVDQGAIDDLATGSAAIMSVELTAVPSHALVGIGGTALTLSVVPGMASLYTIMEFFGAGDVFGAIQNDLIVGRASQVGGLPGAAVSTPFDGVAGIHTCFGILPECGNTGSSAYSTEVMRALNTPLGSSWFGYFPAVSPVSSLIDRESARPRSRSRITGVRAGGLVITSPLTGTKVASGQTIHVTVQAETNTGVTSVLLSGRDVAQVDEAPPFEFDLVIPSAAAGSFELRAVGKSLNGTFYPSGSITLDAEPPGTVTSIEVIPTDVTLRGPGATRLLRVVGTYSDGITREIADLSDTDFVSSSPEIVSALANGVVIARNPGVATVSVANSSVRKDVSVTVADVPEERFVTAPPHRLRHPRTVEPRP